MVGIRAGPSFSDSKVLFRERLGEELERGVEAKTGLALGTDLRCSVTSRLVAVFALEMERLGELGLVHVLTGLDARLLEAGPGRALGVGLGLRAGWGGGDRLGERSLIDIHGIRLDGGPVLGAEIRVEWFATGRLAFHLTGGWRASWVNREGETRDEEGRIVEDPTAVFHSFPLTGGLGLRL